MSEENKYQCDRCKKNLPNYKSYYKHIHRKTPCTSVDDKTYICEICDTQFDNYNTYWTHINRKTPCLSKDQCKEIVQEMQLKNNRLMFFEEKTQQQIEALQEKESEIQKLKEELMRKDSIKSLEKKLDETKDLFEDKMELIQETIEESKDKFFTSTNQQLINLNNNQVNNYNYNDTKTLFNIQLTKAKKERMDHITKDMMLQILNHEDINDTLGDLTTSIYFHPKAPENWRWNVTDLNAQFGALEYEEESNTVIRKSTAQVIRANMQNVMFSVTDILEELRRSRNMNRPQAINTSRLINMMGSDFNDDQINSMKQSAYKGRNFPRTLWNRLDIRVETTKVQGKNSLKALNP